MRLGFVKMIASLVVLVLMMSTQSSYAQPITTAQELLDRCRIQGSTALIRDLTGNDEEQWDEVIAKIESGDPDWVFASDCLANGVYFGGNASAWIDLEVTWAELLTTQPREVLNLEGYGVSIIKACGMPFIEPEKEFLESYLQAALTALATIEDDGLQYAKRSCEARLKDSYERACYIEGGEWVCPSR